jgi:hypothetical protein
MRRLVLLTLSLSFSFAAPCGSVSEHQQCKLNSAGTACAYQSVYLMTACR